MKSAVLSALAVADIEAALTFYRSERTQLAADFIDALEAAARHIEAHPASGSPRYAHELDIPRLRFWQLRRFPFALFYVEHADHLDVIRCVHMSRDIPASLRDDTP